MKTHIKNKTAKIHWWSNLGEAVAAAAFQWLFMSSLLLLFYPKLSTKPEGSHFVISVLLILGALLTFAIVLAWDDFKLPSPLIGLQIFAVSGLVALVRIGEASTSQYMGFVLLLVYATLHLTYTVLKRQKFEIKLDVNLKSKSLVSASRTVGDEPVVAEVTEPQGAQAVETSELETEAPETAELETSEVSVPAEHETSEVVATAEHESPEPADADSDAVEEAESEDGEPVPLRVWITRFLIAALIGAVLFHGVLNGFIHYVYVRAMVAPTFDFGIFAQSMEGIFHTFQPTNTLERNRELSHFAVHFSPVLYLAWLLYAPFRSAAWLNVMQVVPALLALIPLYKGLKLRGLSQNVILTIMILWALSPAQIFSSYYGFHENAFLGLAVITMWYFWEKKSPVGMIVGTLFVLSIKEDAFIYVVAFAMWQLFHGYRVNNRGQMKAAAIQAVGALAYFGVVSSLMRKFGLGTMEASRFGNLIPDGQSGFLAVINTIWNSPAHAYSQLFLTNKMDYIILVLGVTGFALLWIREFEINWLLVPLILVNVIGNWSPQWEIGYQYHYGSSALLLIMLIVGFSNIKQRDNTALGKGFIALVLIVSMIFTLKSTGPGVMQKLVRYQGYMNTVVDHADNVRDYVTSLPKDGTYLTTSAIAPAMYQYQHVYLAEPYWLERSKLPDDVMDGNFDAIIIDERLLEKPEDRKIFDDFLDHFDGIKKPIQPVEHLLVYENTHKSVAK